MFYCYKYIPSDYIVCITICKKKYLYANILKVKITTGTKPFCNGYLITTFGYTIY